MELGGFFATNDRKTLSKTKLKEAVLKVQINLNLNNKWLFYPSGKMFAAVGSVQSMAGIIGTVVYNSIYPLTLSFWPGFCFATGFFLSIFPLSMMG